MHFLTSGDLVAEVRKATLLLYLTTLWGLVPHAALFAY